VEEKYTIANGYKFDATVIYGDTDSVMIKFGNPDLAEVSGRAKPTRSVHNRWHSPRRTRRTAIPFAWGTTAEHGARHKTDDMALGRHWQPC
jgi:hypothetical protein